MKPFRRLLTFALMSALMAWPSLVLACEGCKSTAQAGGTPNAIGEAFGLSIYFMLAVPMVIVAILVRGIVRRCREMDQQNAHLLAAAAPAQGPETIEGLDGAILVR